MIFFDNAVKSLGITENEMLVNKVERTQGNVLDALKRYESHPSVLKIREKVGLADTTFSFSLLGCMLDTWKMVFSSNKKGDHFFY